MDEPPAVGWEGVLREDRGTRLRACTRELRRRVAGTGNDWSGRSVAPHEG